MYKFVLVEFPYIERKTKKLRPVLLLTDASYGRYRIVVVAYVTSQPGEGIDSEVEVAETIENGLIRKSVIKLHKIASIPVSAIKGEFGELSKDKSTEVRKKLAKLLQL
jgi:mRNA interferase MazF